MRSKILLVNFSYSDQEKIKKMFNIEVDIGYISDCVKSLFYKTHKKSNLRAFF